MAAAFSSAKATVMCFSGLDPIVAASAGFEFSDDAVLVAMRDLLLPLTTVLTSNTMEARQTGSGRRVRHL